jgi:hypothetical protein
VIVRPLLLGLAFALGVGYAVFGVRAARGRVTPAPTAADELRGVWHVHTTRSDGRGTLSEVVRAAKAAGDAFVVVTDHDRTVPGEQGWRDGVLVVEGVEVSTRLGHVAAVGLPRPLTAEERAGPDPLAAIAALGGRAVLAHPLHPLRPFRGEGPAADLGPWGFEVFSNDTAWHQALRERAWDRVLLLALELPFDPGRAVLDLAAAPRPELARFDGLAREARRAGRPAPVLLCSADAHGYPSYRAGLEAVSMHVPVRPTGDGARDARAVAAALLDGSATCVLEARGAVARVRYQGGPAAALALDLPAAAPDAAVRLVRDGALVAERPLPLRAGPNAVPLAPLCGGACAPGEYRLELWREGAPWIFTNPAAIE